MKRWILALVLLSACGTPQERCINTATRDLRILDRLIGESQGNLDRGYALEEVVLSRTRWVMCSAGVPATETTPAEPPQMCLSERDYTVTRPKAINLAEERVKVAEMRKKRVVLEREAAKGIASCKLTHPE